MELDLSDIQPLSAPLSFSGNDDKKLDLSDITPIKLPTTQKKTRKDNPNIGESFQPTNSDWSLDKLSSIQELYKQQFGTDLPVSNKGQGSIHNRWNLDHRNSADIGLDPNSKEGQWLKQQLKASNYPFLSFNGPVPGVATDKHIHMGFPSHKVNKKYPVGTKLGSDLDLSDITPIKLDENSTVDDAVDWQSKLRKEVGDTGGIVETGNLDPYHRPIYKHPNDVGYGTTYSMSFEDVDGTSVLVPQIVNGKLLSKQQAINYYEKTGENFGKFKTWQDADKYAEALHNSQDSYLRQTKPDLYKNEELDLSDTPAVKLTDEDVAKVNNIVGVDPNKIGFKIGTRREHIFARDIERANTPNKGPNNPNAVGDLVSTEVTFDKHINLKLQSDRNKVTDTWLAKWNPEYAELNKKFREETHGLNLAVVDNAANLEPLGNGKYKITSRPSAGVQALFESYKKDGIAGFNATNKLIDSQIKENNLDYESSKKFIEDNRAAHPYISAIRAAGQEEILSNIHLARNISALPKALYYGNIYGYDSQQYIDEVNKETEVGQQIEEAASSTYQPPTLLGKVVKGTAAGIFGLPRFIAAGRTIGLPTMVYFENLHRGNRQAAMAALPMAIMEGFGKGLGEFTETAGEGTIAPFVRVSKNDLSLFQDSIINKASTSIRDLSLFERQVLLRGSNALTLTGTSTVSKALSNQPINLQDTVSDLVIGLTFPVGKARRISRVTIIEAEPAKVNQTTSTENTFIYPQLHSATQTVYPLEHPINIPITEAPKFGTKFGLLENQRDIQPVIYPSSESPNVGKYGEAFDPYKYVSEVEKGFQARGSGSSIQLDLDTAAMNWLDLQRSLENNTVSAKGDDLATQITKRNAAQRAYDILEKQLSPEVKEFFTKNEDIIKAALRTNYEASVAKPEFKKFIESVHDAREILNNNGYSIINKLADGSWLVKGKGEEYRPKSDEALRELAGITVSPSSIVQVAKSIDNVSPEKQIEINKTLGNQGAFNRDEFVNRERNYDINQEVRNIITGKNVKAPTKSQGGYINPQEIIDVANIVKKKAVELTQMASFHIEDLYHRGIDADYSIVMNRLSSQIPELVGKMDDKQKRDWYNSGVDYWNSNNADPFFSKMKQDAVEKLPNRFDANQAKNILRQHGNEYEWTTGLKEFLVDKEVQGKKVSKKELIDVIQKGQVRVEASVAEESDAKFNQIYTEKLRLQKQLLEIKNLNFNDSRIKDLEIEINTLEEEQNKLTKPKYSLKAYAGEKLELPGAINSREVKLISPMVRDKLDAQIAYEQELIKKYSISTPFNYESFIGRLTVEESRKLDELQKDNEAQYKVLYKAPHWDEPNVVAHYRSNDRITTDGIPIHFSEEFQSDWMHDIRTQGAKLTRQQAEDYVARAEIRKTKDGSLGIFMPKDFYEKYPNIDSEHPYRFAPRTTIDRLANYDETEFKNETIRALQKNANIGNIEPNPFMFHAWKELVFKRFLRDAVVAKDENGNNKYEGIGWTTARQQQERYGAILEGKNFSWIKNSDGTYTFDMQDLSNGQAHNSPHELNRISLERFAELTTKEAAEEVRNQENILRKKNIASINAREHARNRVPLTGKFSLKEAVELRSGIGKYSDYDVAFVNYAKKIGKRFGANYSQKEIETSDYKIVNRARGDDNPNVENWYVMEPNKYGNRDDNLADYHGRFSSKEEAQRYAEANSLNRRENTHFLEITPSMRSSLSKEGFPLYGLGSSEKLSTKEIGVRNKIVSSDTFDEAKNNLVQALEEHISSEEALRDNSTSRGTVFNSGLSPEAFLDQTKLLYQGLRDFSQFSKEMLTRFGDAVKPYLEDMWMHVKNIHEDERGFLNITKINPRNLNLKTQASKEYLNEPEKHQTIFDWRFTNRAITLAQKDPKFAQPYDILRKGQRATNSFESFVLDNLTSANDYLKKENHDQVGSVLYKGLVDDGKIYSRNELLAGDVATSRPALNIKQADAYENFYKAQHAALDIRKETILYGMRQRAFRLNDRLSTVVVGSTEEANILHDMGELSDKMDGVRDYYNQLKDSGYFSLQRKGKIAAYTEIGGEKYYQQFDSLKKADSWIAEQEANGGINSSIYDIRKLSDISSLSKKLSIGAFEDLVDSSGINAHSPEIEKLRDEIYSQFPSYTYQLKRDFTKGFDRTWESALQAVIRQTELYGSSFYSRVVGEEAKLKLVEIGLEKSDNNLYKLAKAYIEDETVSSESTPLLKAIGGARQAVYFIQLGYDFSQLYMNAIAQPVSQTYNYFARVTHPETGDKLKGLEPEQYFAKGTQLSLELAKDSLSPISKPSANLTEFKDIHSRLVNERVIEPEFTKSLLEIESQGLGKNITQSTLQKLTSKEQHMHWAGVFMRAGELTTRTQAAAEAFLVGKEKFNLNGEPLVDFIVRAVDATQSNPTRGENPYIVRRALGANSASREIGKLFYQFNTFNHMWLENLALNVRSDIKNRTLGATTRTLYPLLIMGGLRGMPLAPLAFGLYTLITGDDPKKKFDSAFRNHQALERTALYGVTQSAALGTKLTPSVPVVDTYQTDRSNVPLFATIGQIQQGLDDLISGQKERGLEEILPRALRGPIKAGRFYSEGVRNRDKTTVIPKRQVTPLQIVGQAINLSPNKVVENYQEQSTKRIQQYHKKYIKPVRRRVGL